MQKILILVNILLLTLNSFGQTDIKTQYSPNKDSLVTIPKQIAVWMIQDIVKSDSYAEEIKLLNNNIDVKQDIITKQDTIINIQKSKLRLKDKELETYQELVDNQEIQLRQLNKSLKSETRQKRFWKITAIVAPCITGFLIHNHWKNGKNW